MTSALPDIDRDLYPLRPASILIVDDDTVYTRIISTQARSRGMQAQVINDPLRFDPELHTDFDILFLDIIMPGIDGISLLANLIACDREISIVLLSAVSNEIMLSIMDMARNTRVSILGHLEKPFSKQQLLEYLDCGKTGARKLASTKPVPAFSRADVERWLKDSLVSIHLQPKVDLATGAWVGNEALARLFDRDGNMIPPDSFLPSIERYAMTEEFSRQIVRLALQANRELIRKTGKTLTIAINVFPELLASDAFVEFLSTMARSMNISPSLIILEITESGKLSDTTRIKANFARLRLAGFKLAIDDFGSGFNDLQNFNLFHFDEVKIDKSYIQNIDKSGKSRVVVEYIMNVTSALNMSIVAEGIEEAKTLGWLQQRGRSIGQGYIFAKPMPLEELAHWSPGLPDGHDTDSDRQRPCPVATQAL